MSGVLEKPRFRVADWTSTGDRSAEGVLLMFPDFQIDVLLAPYYATMMGEALIREADRARERAGIGARPRERQPQA